jgi:hypothetical protein
MFLIKEHSTICDLLRWKSSAGIRRIYPLCLVGFLQLRSLLLFVRCASILALILDVYRRVTFFLSLNGLAYSQHEFQGTNGLVLRNSAHRICGKRTSLLVLFRNEAAMKAYAPLLGVSISEVLSAHDRTMHPHVQSKSNSSQVLDNEWVLIHSCLPCSRTVLQASVPLSFIPPVPVRTFALRTHPRKPWFSWEPLVLAFRALVTIQFDLFHSYSMPIIRT